MVFNNDDSKFENDSINDRIILRIIQAISFTGIK